MSTNQRTFFEGSLLPSLMACFSLGVIALIWLSNKAPIRFKIGMTLFLLLFAGLSACFIFRRRWVVQIVGDMLVYRDLRSKKITQIALSEITSARTERKWVMNDGIGPVDSLIIQTREGTWKYSLPLMAEKPQKIVEAIYRTGRIAK